MTIAFPYSSLWEESSSLVLSSIAEEWTKILIDIYTFIDRKKSFIIDYVCNFSSYLIELEVLDFGNQEKGIDNLNLLSHYSPFFFREISSNQAFYRTLYPHSHNFYHPSCDCSLYFIDSFFTN